MIAIFYLLFSSPICHLIFPSYMNNNFCISFIFFPTLFFIFSCSLSYSGLLPAFFISSSFSSQTFFLLKILLFLTYQFSNLVNLFLPSFLNYSWYSSTSSLALMQTFLWSCCANFSLDMTSNFAHGGDCRGNAGRGD